MVVPFSWWPEDSATEDSRLTVKDYVEQVKFIEEHFGFKRPYRLMDVAGRSMNATEELSYFDAYRDAGMHENRETSGAPRPERERGRSAKAESHTADARSTQHQPDTVRGSSPPQISRNDLARPNWQKSMK
jgi:hypothetical protein